jgi:nucleotide-binding universal stress UspA family protein
MPSIREILFPTDLSPEADLAFDHVRFLSERFQASVTLYHVVEVPDQRFAHWAFAHGHAIWLHAEAEARECLARRAQCLKVDNRVVVERKASAPQAVLDMISAAQPDLTVMATHGRQGLEHMLVGSVTERVIRHAARSVLCIRENERGRVAPYRRIVVPTDLSLASRSAFPMAALMARTFGAKVVAVHVAPYATLATLSGVPPVDLPVVPSEATLWKYMQEDFQDVDVTAQVHNGSAWDRILHVARVEKADLIVMATRGHDSLADRILGSNTDRVVRHAPCPVLVS